MRAGLAQTEIGGPFVVRSNPVGAVFDAIRRFCSPLPQEEDGDDGYLAGEYSTPEYTAGFASAPLDSGWFAGLVGFGPPDVAPAAAPEAPAAAASDPCGLEAAVSARSALRAAKAAADCEGVRRVLDLARECRGTNNKASAFLRWQPIAADAKGWLERNARRCRR